MKLRTKLLLPAALLYLLWVAACTVLLCAKNAFAGNQWSRTAAILGYSRAGAQFFLPSSVRTMEAATPLACSLTIFALMLAYSLVLAFFMLWLGLWRGRRAAFLGSLGFSLYGFLLRKETVTALLRLGPAESFRASVLLGWISPLNHASYAMHSFGYDRLPTLEMSFALFLGLLAALFFFARRSVRRYHFLFWGRQGDL